jgi:Zn-dependent protease
MYRQDISAVEMGFNIPIPFYLPIVDPNRNLNSSIASCVPIVSYFESDEGKHKINCCLYISKIIVSLLGGSVGFVGANASAKSFGFSDPISLSFGLVGMAAISIISLNSLSEVPVRGRAVLDIQKDKTQKILSILNPIGSVALGFLSAKSADLIFDSLGLNKGQISDVLNVILAIMSGLSGFLALSGFCNARNQVSINYDAFLAQQNNSVRFFIKLMSVLCYISSLVCIAAIAPSISSVVSEKINDNIFTKITGYVLGGTACYGFSDLYYNCFKMFAQKMNEIILNFGAEKFQNVLRIIFGAIFLFVQSMSNYGLGSSASKSSAVLFNQPESNIANIIFGILTVVGTTSASVLSGYASAESVYKKSKDLYQYVRRRFGC